MVRGSGLDMTAYEPRNISQATTMAKILANSGLLGKVPPRPETVLFLMARGRELGFSTAQSLAAFHIIDGVPSLKAQAQVALVKRRRDVCEYLVWKGGDATASTWETQRVGDPEPTSFTYTIDDALLMGLLDRKQGSGPSPWEKQPATMLRWRSATSLIATVYPDLVLGLYDPEEHREIAAAGGHHVVDGTFTVAPETVEARVVETVYDPATEEPQSEDEDDTALAALADNPTTDPQPGVDRPYQEGDPCAERGCRGRYKVAKGGAHAGDLQCNAKVGGVYMNHPAPAGSLPSDPSGPSSPVGAAPDVSVREAVQAATAPPATAELPASVLTLFSALADATPTRWAVVSRHGWKSGKSLSVWVEEQPEATLLAVYDDLVALRDAQDIPA